MKKTDITATLADLTAACGEKILNPDFLLQGGGEPFAEQNKHLVQRQNVCNNDATNGLRNVPNKDIVTNVQTDMSNTNAKLVQENETESCSDIKSHSPIDEDPFEFMMKRPVITLYSQKMKGLKDLLLAEKLNTHAISLQVTAQSVASKKIRGIDKLGNHTTTSTYATAHAPGNNLLSLHTNYNTILGESNTNSNDNGNTATTMAASRPKRSRRE